MMLCPSCGRAYDPPARFCATCAQSDGAPVALRAAGAAQAGAAAPTRPAVQAPTAAGGAAARAPAAPPTQTAAPRAGPAATPGKPQGIAIGEQAVVSGDVIGHQVQHIYQGTANVTNITQVDDTKRMLSCAICGLGGTLADGFHACPGCARTTCAKHFDEQARLCADCRDSASTVKEDLYRQQVRRFLEPGCVIDAVERQQLDESRQSLGLSAVRAADLERSVKDCHPGGGWGALQQRQLEAARRMLIAGAVTPEALSYLEPLAQRHPEHHELQALWLEALAEADPERALELSAHAAVDVPAHPLVRARLLAARGRYQEAIDLLDDARTKQRLEVAHVRFTAAAAELAMLQARATGNRLYLADAEARLAEITGSRDPYVQALVRLLALLRGATPPPPPAVPAADLATRRALLQEAAARATIQAAAPPPTGRILRSHAPRSATVWTTAPGQAGYIRDEDARGSGSSSAQRAIVPGAKQVPLDKPPREGDPPTTRVFHRLTPTERIADEGDAPNVAPPGDGAI